METAQSKVIFMLSARRIFTAAAVVICFLLVSAVASNMNIPTRKLGNPLIWLDLITGRRSPVSQVDGKNLSLSVDVSTVFDKIQPGVYIEPTSTQKDSGRDSGVDLISQITAAEHPLYVSNERIHLLPAKFSFPINESFFSEVTLVVESITTNGTVVLHLNQLKIKLNPGESTTVGVTKGKEGALLYFESQTIWEKRLNKSLTAQRPVGVWQITNTGWK